MQALITASAAPTNATDGEPLFYGVAAWPHLQKICKERGRPLGQDSYQSDLRGGGSGEVPFNGASDLAQTVLAEILQESRGFLWTDHHNRSWAVAVCDPVPGRRDVAYAVNWHGSVRVLDPLLRRPWILYVQKWFAEHCGPDKVLPAPSPSPSPFELTTAQDIDFALDCLPGIAKHVHNPGRHPRTQLLIDSLWPDGIDRPNLWCLRLQSAIGALCGMHLMKLRWERPYWTPHIARSGTVAAHVDRYGWTRIDPMILDVLPAFARA